jgi:kynureninase
VPLALHADGVDAAAWCTYKYLNSGPGGIAGLFVHEKHDGADLTRLEGWWGNKRETKFEMRQKIDLAPGADAFMVSNPSALDLAALCGSLSVFDRTSMPKLRERADLLFAYFMLLRETHASEQKEPFSIITPLAQRGNQLSLFWEDEERGRAAKARLDAAGIVVDFRFAHPGAVLRLAFAPLYTSFWDVRRLWLALADLK